MALAKEKGHFSVNESMLAKAKVKHPEFVSATQKLFNDVVMFYVDVRSKDMTLFLSTKTEDLYVIYEPLTIINSKRKKVAYPLPFFCVPADFRRAAIKKAAGVVKSWNSNFQRWLARINKASSAATLKKQTRLKKKAGKPPSLPKTTNFPAQLYSCMFSSDDGQSVIVKLWTGKCWVKEKADYQCREIPDGYQKGTMSLIFNDGEILMVWVIQKNTKSNGKLDDHIKAFGRIRILSIDLNLDDPIVVGKVLEGYEDTGLVVELTTLILKGNNSLNHLRKRYLGLIAKAKSLTNTRTELGKKTPDRMCFRLWKKIKSLEKELIETISNKIVKFARQHNCQVIIFENLKSLKALRGKYSRRSNTKRSFWVAKKIQKRTQEKALNRFSIYVTKVNPSHTSITDAYEGGKCLRGSQVGALNLYLWSARGLGKFIKTPEGKIYDSGENAARNIGLKYLAGKFKKPVSIKSPGSPTGCVAWLPKPGGEGKVVIPSWFVCTDAAGIEIPAK